MLSAVNGCNLHVQREPQRVSNPLNPSIAMPTTFHPSYTTSIHFLYNLPVQSPFSHIFTPGTSLILLPRSKIHQSPNSDSPPSSGHVFVSCCAFISRFLSLTLIISVISTRIWDRLKRERENHLRLVPREWDMLSWAEFWYSRLILEQESSDGSMIVWSA